MRDVGEDDVQVPLHKVEVEPATGNKDYLLPKNKVEDYFTDLFSRVAWDSFF